jgi:hypothetical protein
MDGENAEQHAARHTLLRHTPFHRFLVAFSVRPEGRESEARFGVRRRPQGLRPTQMLRKVMTAEHAVSPCNSTQA